jgi:hypothetical protein
MACNKCGNTTSNPCACKDTAYTIPTPCLEGYAGSGCSSTANTCDEIVCLECLKNCHGVAGSSMCVEIQGRNFCINHGESFESFFQKLMLILSGNATEALNNNIAITPFYVASLSSTSLTLAWDWNGMTEVSMGTVDGFLIRYALLESPNNFTIITNPALPVTLTSWTIPSTVFPYVSGQTYIFQISPTVNGYNLNGISAVNVYVTIP